jgi:hypothetical protein
VGARPYDSSTGRFVAPDPVDGGSLNAYDYAGQDPINNYDLAGTCMGIPFTGACPWASVVHNALNAGAFVVYAPYYAIHWTGKKTHDLIFLGPFGLDLLALESGSLGGDVGLDWIKKHLGYERSLCDEGPGQHLNPFHRKGKGHSFLPGCRIAHGHVVIDLP